MTAPADGIDRLIYYVDARLAQLNLSKEEVARRGGPSTDTLAKIRVSADQRTPMVDTLLRLDRSLGWQPGSSAVVLLGGQPLSLTARRRRKTLAKQRDARPVDEAEILDRLTAELAEEIARLEGDRDAVTVRIQRLRTVHDHLVAELTVDEELLADYGVGRDDVATAPG
jgi:hypothetical protein